MSESATPNSLSDLPKSSSVIGLYLIVLTATAIITPMIFLGNASGHDFQPHVASWIEAAAQWREGIAYPRWTEWANSGFGEPRFIFYPPLSWVLGAAFGSFLPWKMVPGVFVWLSVLIAGLGMWRFARQWLSPRQAIAAALFFAANPYHLALIYYRSDFAELLASALFPLLLQGAFGVLRRRWQSVPILAFAFAGVWLSNAPAGIIASYSLTLLLVIAAIVGRSIWPVVSGGLSMLAGFGVAAFYIVPAWWEQRWVQITAAVSTTYNPEHNFLFARSNDADFVQFNWKISAIAIVVMVLTTVAITLSLKLRRNQAQLWWILGVLSFISVFLMLPLSVLVWRHLPELRYLQFPWRWLLVLNLSFAFFVAAMSARRWQYIWWLTVAIAICATGLTIAGDTYWDSEDLPAIVEDIRAGRGYEGIEGFQPRDAKVDQLDDESPLVGEFDPESGDVDAPEKAQIDVKRWSAESKVFDARSDEPVTLALRLLQFPAWQVRIDGQVSRTDIAPQTGQILVPLNGGTHHVEVYFRRTRDQTLGMLISILTIASLLMPAAFVLRRTRTSKSK